MINNAAEPRPDLRTLEIQRGKAGTDRVIWVVLGLVAVVAILALAFVFTQNSDQSRQAAFDQATAQQRAVDAAGQASNSAQSAAATANQAATSAGQAAGKAAQSAADRASAAADQVPPASQPAAPPDSGTSTNGQSQ